MITMADGLWIKASDVVAASVRKMPACPPMEFASPGPLRKELRNLSTLPGRPPRHPRGAPQSEHIARADPQGAPQSGRPGPAGTAPSAESGVAEHGLCEIIGIDGAHRDLNGSARFVVVVIDRQDTGQPQRRAGVDQPGGDDACYEP